MRYEDMVRRVCGEDWRTVNPQEREGGYGVACVLGFIRGAKPTVGEMAGHLGITPDEIIVAMTRLNRNGIFTPRFNARKDPELAKHLSQQDAQRAWSQIAAIAGGFLGV